MPYVYIIQGSSFLIASWITGGNSFILPACHFGPSFSQQSSAVVGRSFLYALKKSRPISFLLLLDRSARSIGLMFRISVSLGPQNFILAPLLSIRCPPLSSVHSLET